MKLKERRKDPIVKLRHEISTLVRHYINGTKIGSIMEYLKYSIEELRLHLENQFEPWMTWDNWGLYKPKEWDDNDSTTWKWQIDHIIPHSLFEYSLMADESFQQCWALSNLRPLSAKQNQLDGANKIRHKNIKK
jgi:hypothetical protein